MHVQEVRQPISTMPSADCEVRNKLRHFQKRLRERGFICRPMSHIRALQAGLADVTPDFYRANGTPVVRLVYGKREVFALLSELSAGGYVLTTVYTFAMLTTTEQACAAALRLN